jgi:hypothetical protein
MILSTSGTKMVKVEFYKIAIGGGVGRVLDTQQVEAFSDKTAFDSWAERALSSRRSDPRIWEWPEGVHVLATDGSEQYKWDLWDQFQMTKPKRR